LTDFDRPLFSAAKENPMPRLIASILLTAALSGCLSAPLPPYRGRPVVEVDLHEFERLPARQWRDEARVQTRRARCVAAFSRTGARTTLCR
jgi:hypothetical protein